MGMTKREQRRRSMSPGWKGPAPSYLGGSVSLSEWPMALRNTPQYRKLLNDEKSRRRTQGRPDPAR